MSILSFLGLPDDYFSNPGAYHLSYSDAKEAYESNPVSGFGDVVGRTLSNMTSAEPVASAAEMLGSFSDYLGELFETSENAAKNQADRNELAAFNAWQRSEQAADAALKRARELRRTSYQDAVSSLKAAGLNPVLAAGGGISGSAVTAPQANAPASSSGMADGLNAADLLTAIASLLTGAGSLIGSVNPKRIISNVTGNYTNTSTSTSTSENTSWIHHSYSGKK